MAKMLPEDIADGGKDDAQENSRGQKKKKHHGNVPPQFLHHAVRSGNSGRGVPSNPSKGGQPSNLPPAFMNALLNKATKKSKG